jgi:hypothetical protein
VEARVLGDHLAELSNEAVDPIHTIGLSKVWNSRNRHLSNSRNSVLEVVQEKRLQIFHEKLIVLTLNCQLSNVPGQL